MIGFDLLSRFDAQQNEFLSELVQLIATTLGFPTCYISILDNKTQWFLAQHGLGLTSTPREMSFCQHVVDQRQRLIVENTLEDASFSDNPLVVGAPGIRFYAGIPLEIEGNCIGAVCLVDSEKRVFSASQQLQLERFTDVVIKVIAFNTLQRTSIEEQQLLNHSPATLIRWRMTPHSQVHFVSENIATLFGITGSDLRNKSWVFENHIHPNDLSNFLTTVQNHRAGAIYCETEYRLIGVNDKPNWVKQVSLGIFDKDNRLIAIDALLLENSQQKHLEKQLLTTNERLRLLLEASDLGTWDWDIENDINIVNKKWCDMLGLDVDFNDKSSIFWQKRIHPADAQLVKTALYKHLKNETDVFNVKYRMRHEAGHWVWIETYAKTVSTDATGKNKRLTGTHRDISIEIQAEQAKEQQQRLMQLINKAQNVFIDSLDIHYACTEIFDEFLALAQSEFGFIGQVQYPDETPILHIHALTDISWGGSSNVFVEKYKKGELYFTNLDNLFGHVITANKTVITNQPSKHTAAKGVPSGHPTLYRFMGLPITSRGQVVGMIGLANKISDYLETDAAFLQPLLDTLGSLFYAVESEKARKAAEDKLFQLANSDTLTGVMNRRAFISSAYECYQTETLPFVLVIIDIDFFKKVNDTYGHHIGDAVLQHVAGTLKSLLRSDDHFARLGGEEFGLFLKAVETKQVANILNHLRESIAQQKIIIDDLTLQITISLGANIIYPSTKQDYINAFEKDMIAADQALYKAKAQGRNCIQLCSCDNLDLL
ncbi:sensor domain-containing diguanylate cyclase [Alishewanella longhuensis]